MTYWDSPDVQEGGITSCLAKVTGSTFGASSFIGQAVNVEVEVISAAASISVLDSEEAVGVPRVIVWQNS